jgi:hypothetical protein
MTRGYADTNLCVSVRFRNGSQGSARFGAQPQAAGTSGAHPCGPGRLVVVGAPLPGGAVTVAYDCSGASMNISHLASSPTERDEGKETAMSKTLVVVADRGRFKAFELVRGEDDSRAHLKLVETKDQPLMRSKLSEQVSDSAGRFQHSRAPRQAGQPEMSSMGERHDMELERHRRAARAVAHEIDGLLAGKEFGSCWLAASHSSHHVLLDMVRPATRAKIRRVLPLDLTKSAPREVLEHFECAAQASAG